MLGELAAEGAASDKPDCDGTDEQDDPDDREPYQAIEGKPDNYYDKPGYEKNCEKDKHTKLPRGRAAHNCRRWRSAETWLPHPRLALQPVHPLIVADLTEQVVCEENTLEP